MPPPLLLRLYQYLRLISEHKAEKRKERVIEHNQQTPEIGTRAREGQLRQSIQMKCNYECLLNPVETIRLAKRTSDSRDEEDTRKYPDRLQYMRRPKTKCFIHPWGKVTEDWKKLLHQPFRIMQPAAGRHDVADWSLKKQNPSHQALADRLIDCLIDR